MGEYSKLWVKMKQNRITQKRLAEYMGLSEQWISDVFNGKRDSKQMFERIETAINELIQEEA